MPTVTVVAAADAYLRENNPIGRYGGAAVLSVAGGSSPRDSLVYFNQPMPSGVKVQSATLRLHQRGAATGGTRTLSVKRLGAGFVESTVAWTGSPAGIGTAATRALGNSSTDGRAWDFNVAAIMQMVSDGSSPWYGFRVTSDLSTLMSLYGRESAGEFVPTLTVTYSDLPSAPTQLSPAGGRAVSIARPTFRFGYLDPVGDDPLIAIQVQTSASTSFTSPLLDSGEVATSEPEWTPGTDIAVGTYYWRARVKDGSGEWSPWSATAQFSRTAKPTVSITAPAASPNNVVYTSTPTFAWTVSGGTQTASQVFVVDADDPATVVWDSGKRSGSVGSVAIPQTDRLLLVPTENYRAVVRVWDAVAREGVPEDPAYTEVSRDFTYGFTGSVAGVTGLDVVDVDDPKSPFVTLQWTRSTAPDAFVITDGGRPILEIDAEDAFVSGTTYRYEIRGLQPRSSRTVGVSAKVGAQTSATVTKVVETAPTGLWLYSLSSGGPAVKLRSADGQPERVIRVEPSEDSAVFDSVGATESTIITSAVRLAQGEAEGSIRREHLAAWETIAAGRSAPVGITVVDRSFKVRIFNTVTDIAHDQQIDRIIPIRFQYVGAR